MDGIGQKARQASSMLAQAKRQAKDAALLSAAAFIRQNAQAILAANALDMASARAKGLSGALLDRLKLDEKRVEAMAKGLEEVADLADPVGETMAEWTRPNGLRIQRVRVPLGVIGIIYESRPNVTADAGGLCLKSGNAAILRGGSESINSSGAIMDCLQAGLRQAGLPQEALQMVPVADRAAVGHMLTMTKYIDVIVPRGGKSLIERVIKESRIPLFQHLEGLCHTYVDGKADLEMARRIVLNAKMRRTGICGATETLLIDRAGAATHLAPIIQDLLDAGCEVRGDESVRTVDARVVAAQDEDWNTEYLDAIISARLVDGLEDAIAFINRHGSQHTDSIVTDDPARAEKFLNEVNSAIVLHNASTQFADGGEFGMGAEIGIATGKLHARGPVGVEQLTTYKYRVLGSGQVRPG
ncbi:MAG: glutamate-5-semialdehyde dehydrogenase [Alphaproteobacteria bacterium]|nr:glutamate-5-semialdehyde dehydrogenase [Alphaproteobacteria bacterium]